MVDAPSSKRGFTLIELMITIAVLAILLTVAVPNFQMFVMNNRMASQTNDLITALSLARSEAVKRAANVTVCASSDGATCTGGWEAGWIVHDSAGNVLRSYAALSGASTLTGSVNQVVFKAAGATTLAASTTLTLCPPSPAAVQGRAIQIERTGRTRFAPVACT